MPEYFLRDRAVIRLTPLTADEDVGAFLQGLVTNDVMQDWLNYTALLTPQGKVLFDFMVEREVDFPPEPSLLGKLRDRDWRNKIHRIPTGDYLIDCEATQVDSLIRRLSIYRLRRKIDIKTDANLGIWWNAGNFHDGWPDPRLDRLGYRGICKNDPRVPDGSDKFRERRLREGVTEGVAELGSDATLWLEANAAELNGVSFNKGCYVGQENTARMNWRQKVNRRLLVVPIVQADPKRLRIAYPDLGVAVVQARVEDVPLEAWPIWLRSAISQPDEAKGDA